MAERLSLRFWARRRVYPVLQSEASECGLACLTMIARFWGHDVDLASLRRRFSISLRGSTLKALMSIAESLELRSRPLKVEMEMLRALRLPCILHWDMNHFVVLEEVGRKAVTVIDPAAGTRRISLAEVSRHFTGVALELMPSPRFRPTTDRQDFTVHSLMGHVVGLHRGLLQLLVLGLSLQVCALTMPFFLQWVVDEALVAADRDLLAVLGIGFFLLVVVQSAIGAVRTWVTTTIATDLNYQWLGNTFTHLIRLPISYFEKRHVGDVISRFGSIQSLQRALTTQFVEAVIDGLLVTATLVVMLMYSVTLSSIAIGTVALYAVTRWLLFGQLKAATGEQIVYAAKQQSHFLESARGVQSIRLLGGHSERTASWMDALANQFDAELRVAKLSISYQTANALLFGAERVIVVWLAATAVMNGAFSVGMLFAFVSYKDQFSQRVAALIDKLNEFRMLRLHGERIADIVLTEPELDRGHVGIDIEKVQPCIELKNVSFRYSEGDSPILHELNLTIPAGQCVAITGASGCGKTTLVKLLLGLLDPSSGEVLVGGKNIDHLGRATYRQMVGAVMQEDFLFSGSIADNVGLFDASPALCDIEECCRLAGIHDEISAMAMGYNTFVGASGSALSGGQKQRILLARALYRKPRILVLDEATSHLDVGNEQSVNAAIRDFPMTRFIVAHRPETIAMAQRVVVLENGRIVRDLQQQPCEISTHI